MNILFPASPIDNKLVDHAFEAEANHAKAEGFTVGMVDLEAVLGGDIRVRGLSDSGPVLYRGWLMTPPRYRAINERLGGRLVTPPEAYEVAYHLPEWYPLFPEGATPRTLVIPGEMFDLKDVAEKVRNEFWSSLSKANQARAAAFSQWIVEETAKHGFFNPNWPTDLLELPRKRPVILKDYLKSAKHLWFDACFIPDCRDVENTMRVTKNFIEAQGDNLTGGLCFREFIECKPIGLHPKTHQPLVNEWRAFMSFGKVFSFRPYWAGHDYTQTSVPKAEVVEEMCVGLAKLPFVALDIGERLGGGWVTFEVNDGGSAGIPGDGDVRDFYHRLAETFPG